MGRPYALLCLLAVLALSSCTGAQRTPSIRVVGEDMLVVLNQDGASAWLLDAVTGSVLARLPTGVGPHEVAVSPDGRSAVVTDYGDRTTLGASLTVLDLASRTVERTIPLGEFERPHGIAFLPDGRVAVTAERDSAVVVVDVAAGRVSFTAPTGHALSHLLALSPDGRTAFTGNVGSGSVSRIDLGERRTVAVGPVGPYAEAVALSPDGREVWAASQETGLVVALDARTLERLGTAEVPGRPIRIAFTPDGRHALVTAAKGDALHMFDARTRRPVGVVTFPAGAAPSGIAVARDSRRAYVALTGQDQLAVVDLDALAVIGLFATGPVPDGIAMARSLSR